MDWPRRLVASLPMRELWTDHGPLRAVRQRSIGAGEIQALLDDGPVRLAFADVGQKLNWVGPSQAHAYWKSEIAPHLAEPGSLDGAEAYPGGYCYQASEWQDEEGVPVVVLEVERAEK